MVKKTSIFARIRERFGSTGSVRVDERRPADSRAEPAKATVRRVDGSGGQAHAPNGNGNHGTGNGGANLPSQQVGELKTTRKMSDREEAMVALGEHFAELAGLMRGSHTRMDAQTQKLVEAAESLRQMPVLSNRQLEVLQGLAAHMERQNQLGERVAQTLTALPRLMESVEGALARAAAADERTTTTMREFQGTMDRIQTAMGKMVEHSEVQANAARSLAEKREESLTNLTKGLETAQRESVAELRTVADESMKSLRRAHEDQSNRLHKVVQEHAGWNKAVLGMLGVVLMVLVALLVMQLVK